MQTDATLSLRGKTLLICFLGGLVAVLAWLTFFSSPTTNAETCYQNQKTIEWSIKEVCTGVKQVIDHYENQRIKVNYQKRVCEDPPRCRTINRVWASSPGIAPKIIRVKGISAHWRK